MPKIGFNNQWIEIARVGKVADSTGTARDLSKDWITRVIANYAASGHDAPIVVGHPDSDTAPAFGWATELRLNGDVLEARFADTDEAFEKLVESGRYKKRSASFYLDPPNLRHVGFLGGQAPAIKGLRDIKFSDGDSFAIEVTNLKEQEKKMEEKDLDQLPESFWEKIKSKLGVNQKAEFKEGEEKDEKPVVPAASLDLSEELKAHVASAIETASADFKEQIKTLKQEKDELAKRFDAASSNTRRTEIASFVEAIPAEKGRHYLKRAGIVEFMESLAVADAKDAKPAISFSEKAGEKPVEFSRVEWFKQLVAELPTIVQFGEKFGDLVASPEAGKLVNTDRINAMKQAAGVAVVPANANGGAK
ncbi:MAG TPA: hypothetical protein PKC89_15000 [Pyrinomonadaceae bacterium]|nr:hypothetical protein [Pyrinomonadaceae bacterium]